MQRTLRYNLDLLCSGLGRPSLSVPQSGRSWSQPAPCWLQPRWPCPGFSLVGPGFDLISPGFGPGLRLTGPGLDIVGRGLALLYPGLLGPSRGLFSRGQGRYSEDRSSSL
ncbi:hypothetical protein ISCGN_016132 [Ixodes scapularis]